MSFLLIHRIVLIAGLSLLGLLAIACAASSDSTGTAPAATTAQQQAPAAAATNVPAATAVPADSATAAVTSEERPTLKVGVIWLSSPLDPVESGWVANQSAMSENLFRLSGSTLAPEPWLATGATQLEPLTWESSYGLMSDSTTGTRWTPRRSRHRWKGRYDCLRRRQKTWASIPWL